MFFFLSKTAGALLMPSNLGLSLIALGLLLRWRRKRLGLARWALRGGVAVLVLFSLPVCSQLMLTPLEEAYPRRELAERPPAAIVMLTGTLHIPISGEDAPAEFFEAADRFVETLRLAHRYPRAKVLILGGSGSLIDDAFREGRVLGKLAGELGVDPARLVIDPNSRNTHENAVNGSELLAKLPAGDALLVTSAFHMPRAVACFAKAQKQDTRTRRIVPWPVDYRRIALRHSSFIPRIYGLELSERVINEYAGLLVYWLVGYI
ncbi:MAG: hypothetical protein CSA65_00880 [Proteobacteria bacterium]|nr:MAG: hypothetical protein CSA65_00880 [Pseudomonadota bacterium]